MAFEGSLSEALSVRVFSLWRPTAIAATFVAAMCLVGCSGTLNSTDLSPNNVVSPAAAAAPAPASNLGTGDVKVGLILPLSASGNAGIAGQSMRNAAEMALAEFSDPNIQLLPKDDNGT